MSDTERLTQEYVQSKAHLDALKKRVDDIKGLLQKEVNEGGWMDDKGHIRATAGRYQLQLQRRQGKPYLDREAAEQLAHNMKVWEEVSTPVLDEDKLAAWMYEHRNEEWEEQKISDLYEAMFVTPEPTWAFMPPVEAQYDDY